MKTILNVRLMFAFLAAAVPQAAMSTVFFTDNFSSGSTLNGPTLVPGGTSTASFTSYQVAASKNATNSTIEPNDLSLHLVAATSSGFWEAQALFTTNAVVLTTPGDFVAIAVVFTNSSNSLFPSSTSPVWIGLYNSGSSPGNTNFPVSGGQLDNSGLTTSSTFATGNCAPWEGYLARMFNGAGSLIATRPIQNGASTPTTQDQDLVASSSISSTSGYLNPPATTFTAGPSETFTLATNAPYTAYLSITLDPAGSGNLIISNALFSGAGIGGTSVTSNSATTTAATLFTPAFDGLALGADDKTTSSTEFNPQMDISSITISGSTTPPNSPPNISSEPASVSVATGGSCAFFVTALGYNMTYQWHRNGTNLINGGNISGVNTSTLVISPAGSADVLSGANGYYVTITGAGGFSTNSTTNSLALITATSLFWNRGDFDWDVDTSLSWTNSSGESEVFNFGDPVTFNNGGAGGAVNLIGPFLSASSVTVDADIQYTYTFQGSGSFAGPGSLIDMGACQLTLNNVNTYSGGTLISNSEAYVYLENYGGLGTGPLTLALAGGEMEFVNAGSAGVGINGEIIVADDFDIQVDSGGNYGGVFLGDFSGTASKTLTLTPGPTNNTVPSRIRAYGINTVYNANLDLAGSVILFAPYEASGSQAYNGVISGSGAVMQKASTITYFNGQNTYTGGTYVPAGTLGLGCSSMGNISSGPIGTGPLYLNVDSTTGTTGTGQMLASGGPQTIANPIEYPTGTNNLTFVIGGTNNLTFTGPYTLNGNDNATTFISRSIQVTNTGLTTISGVISDGGLGCSLNFSGPGVLALNNTETYTGATTISNGTLEVNGQLNVASAVTVQSNGILAGTGTVGGPVTVQSGGGVTAGDQAIGTLTINNTLTLQSGSSNSIKINVTAHTHDLVAANTINYGGNLSVTNLSGTPSVGATYTVFSTGTKTGNFSSVTGSPGPGLGWSFTPSSGVLTVVGVVNTTPTNISYTVTTSGSTVNLGLSWPVDHTGWTLQSQTNLWKTNWANVAGSTGTNAVTIPINPGTPEIFYRLVYP